MANSENMFPDENNSQVGEDNDLDKTTPMPTSTGEPSSPEEQDDETPENIPGGETVPEGLEETVPTIAQPSGVVVSSQSSDEGLTVAMTAAPSPTEPQEPVQEPASSPKGRSRLSLLIFIMLGLLVLFLIAAISAFSGYQSGIDMRQNAESTQLVVHIQEQYALGIQEMEQGVYYRARQRFEYVIQLDPNYPGVTENLALVLLELNTTATPTLVPTPTITPTPDTRGIEELYDQGQQHLANSEWTESMDALLMVRKTDPEYHAVEIDGMLYLALRNRGMDKISKEADLEGGIYDLTLAEQFGPLDTEAQGFLNWASLYITGASFWEIDWGQAVYYLSQVAPHLPSLRDGSGWTALERYRFALIEFGFVLANQKEWCQAQDQLAAALSIAPDEKAQEAWAIVAERCANQNQPQQPGGDDQPKPTKTP